MSRKPNRYRRSLELHPDSTVELLMNQDPSSASNGFRELHNQTVLVLPSTSNENPSTGMRGTIHVTPENQVELILDYAVMFDRPAARQVVRLTHEEVARLIQSRSENGDYSFKLERDVIPPTTSGYVVNSPRL